MLQLGVFEAKNKLSALLDLVEKGETVLITRNGKPAARLIAPESEDEARRRRRKAAEDLIEHSKGLSLGSISIRSLIDEGRKY